MRVSRLAVEAGGSLASSLAGAVALILSVGAIVTILFWLALAAFVGGVTPTGWAVSGALLLPLAFAFLNARQVYHGAMWRILPWLAWLFAFIALLAAVAWLLPHDFPLHHSDALPHQENGP